MKNYGRFLCFIIFYSCSILQQQVAAQPQSIHQTALEQRIDSIFKHINSTASPGIAITVLQNGKVLAKKNYGMASLEHRIPFTHQSVIRLGYSGGREFMCVALAMMEAEGLLRFEDKVKKYFPKLPGWSEKVTIQDLLNHSSGFDDEWATLLLTQASMGNRIDKEQLLELLYNQPLPQIEPGKGYMYCNSDFALLRFIMEKSSGQQLPAYLRKKLFEPLNMKATLMNDDLGQVIPNLAEEYYGDGIYQKARQPKTSPGGNYRIATTADDLEKWLIAHEDTNSIVSKSIRRLKKNARPIPVLADKHYTFGHEIQQQDGIQLIKHCGVNKDVYITRIPSKNVVIIGLGNNAGNMTKAESIADFLINKNRSNKTSKPVFTSTSVKPDKSTMSKYAGRYLEQTTATHSSHLKHIRYYDVKLEGDSLNFYFVRNESFPLLPMAAEGLFKDPDYGTHLLFSQSHPDSMMKLRAYVPDGTEILLHRVKQLGSMGMVTKEYLQKFTGQYYSKHLDFYCRLVLNEKNELILKRPTISDKPLEPYALNQFLFEMQDWEGSGWNVVTTFTFNEKGEVNGFDLKHVRLMHHRFDKVK